MSATTAEGGLTGLALVGAGGLIVYGSTLAIAFRAGAWRPRRAPRG